jgi:FkbM family methyltransferase
MLRTRLPLEKLVALLPIAQKAKVVDIALAHIAEISYFRLAQQGFRPNGIIDIGAYQGNWTRMVAKIFPQVPVIMIEAQDEKKRSLELVRADLPFVDYTLCLLGDREGEQATFYVMETGSSIYSENSDVQRRRRCLTMRTLDAVLSEHPQLVEPLFIKLDVQGAELDVLRGGLSALRSSEVVQIEVALMNYNAGGAEAIDVFNFMADHGFALYDICGFIRPQSSYLVQVDVLFIKRGSALRPNYFTFN